jgi:ATP-dependent RNA helicase DHX29
VLRIPGRTFPVTVHHLEEVIDITGYDLGNSVLSERNAHDYAREIKFEYSNSTGSRELTQALSVASTTAATKYNQEDENMLDGMLRQRMDMEMVQHILEFIHRTHFEEAANCAGGAVLVFMSGLAPIRDLAGRLEHSPLFSDSSRFEVHVLHSSVSAAKQRLVFRTPRSKRVMKIVISTNIAETGVTIPDVVFVVDSGRVKQMTYDSKQRMRRLMEQSVAKANAVQRTVRAVRVRSGVCYRLFTERNFEAMRDRPQPEMLRLPLDGVVLTILLLFSDSPEEFLGQALSPPSEKSLSRTLQTLVDVDAIEEVVVQEDGGGVASTQEEDKEEAFTLRRHRKFRLTPAGHFLAKLPTDVHVGRVLLFGTLLRCLDPALTVAAVMSASKSMFITQTASVPALADLPDAQARVVETSDHLCAHHHFRLWAAASARSRKEGQEYLLRYGLNRMSMEEIRGIKQQLKGVVLGLDLSLG